MTNWLMTNVKIPPRIAKPASMTKATAPPRGAPRRSNQSTAGTSNALTINASNSGTTMISSRAITHSNATSAARMTNNRQDQAAAFRTMGSTESSYFASVFDGIWPSLTAEAKVTVRKHSADTRAAHRLQCDRRGYADECVSRRAGHNRERPARRTRPRQVLVGALGRSGRRCDRARGRRGAGLGPAGKGREEPVLSEVVLAAGLGPCRRRLDAQLR